MWAIPQSGWTKEGPALWPHGENAVSAVCWSPLGDLLITASRDGTAAVINVKLGSVVARLDGHLGEVTAIAVAPVRVVCGNLKTLANL